MSFFFGLLVGVVLGGIGYFLLWANETYKMKINAKAKAEAENRARYYNCIWCGVRLLKTSAFNHTRSRKHKRNVASLSELNEEGVIECVPSETEEMKSSEVPRTLTSMWS